MADPENNFKTHLKTIKELKGKKRFEFIWEYYRLQIIVTLAVLLFVVYFVNSSIFNREKYDLTIAIYGNYIDTDERQEIETHLEENLSVSIRVISFGVYSLDPQLSESQTAAFMGEYRLGGIDVIITSEAQMQLLSNSGYVNFYESYYDDLCIAVALNSNNIELSAEAIKNILFIKAD